MKTVAFSLYDGFAEVAFGGSQGAIVLDAGDIDADTRLQIAKELGFPATCFVSAYDSNSIAARFQSTKREYPMCGHGTICLMTYMIDLGVLSWQGKQLIEVELRLPASVALVEIHCDENKRAVVMLDILPPTFRQDNLDMNKLAKLLGLGVENFATGLPIETAIGDFKHLVVPIADLAAINRIEADFAGMINFCRSFDIETIACFCTQTVSEDHDIHVRDFCPAVGVPESAAAGTTNSALTSYLIRHDLVTFSTSGNIKIKAEQGLEINRPSSIESRVTMHEGVIGRLQVGGVAVRVLEGVLSLP